MQFWVLQQQTISNAIRASVKQALKINKIGKTINHHTAGTWVLLKRNEMIK